MNKSFRVCKINITVWVSYKSKNFDRIIFITLFACSENQWSVSMGHLGPLFHRSGSSNQDFINTKTTACLDEGEYSSVKSTKKIAFFSLFEI